MPSLARVMPVISLFIACSFLKPWLVGDAILGIAVAVILEHFLYDLGLEFAVGAFCHFGQIKILDWITVGIELEAAAQRREVGLLQRRGHRVLVGKVAP